VENNAHYYDHGVLEDLSVFGFKVNLSEELIYGLNELGVKLSGVLENMILQ